MKNKSRVRFAAEIKLERFGDQKMLEILELIRAILKGEDNADNSERP